MKRISSLLLVLLLCSFFVTGCEEKEVVTSAGEDVNVASMQHKHCTRSGSIDTGSEVSLNYDLYYTGEALNNLKSEEKVISSDQDVLTTYENAFEVVKRVDAAVNICSRLTQLIIIHRFLELSESDWYVGYMTRNTYYRYREKAINEFFDALEL